MHFIFIIYIILGIYKVPLQDVSSAACNALFIFDRKHHGHERSLNKVSFVNLDAEITIAIQNALKSRAIQVSLDKSYYDQQPVSVA